MCGRAARTRFAHLARDKYADEGASERFPQQLPIRRRRSRSRAALQRGRGRPEVTRAHRWRHSPCSAAVAGGLAGRAGLGEGSRGEPRAVAITDQARSRRAPSSSTTSRTCSSMSNRPGSSLPNATPKSKATIGSLSGSCRRSPAKRAKRTAAVPTPRRSSADAPPTPPRVDLRLFAVGYGCLFVAT